jgi:hypothetical protein
MLETRARNFHHALVVNNTDVFDAEFYSEKNIEWACLILDSRLIAVNFESFLIPMLDFVNYAENSQSPERLFRPRFNEAYTTTEVKANSLVREGDEIFENLGYNNDNYLLYHGIVLRDNSYDCYSMSLSFTERQDDNLRETRKTFFGRYFLYDKNNLDLMDECISLKNPFSRRLLFFYYTLLMDEIDMEKTDPKRFGLENDRIILENVKNAMMNLHDLYSSKYESDQVRADREPEQYKKNVIQYMIEQKKLLTKLIQIYQIQSNKLNKDDVL